MQWKKKRGTHACTHTQQQQRRQDRGRRTAIHVDVAHLLGFEHAGVKHAVVEQDKHALVDAHVVELAQLGHDLADLLARILVKHARVGHELAKHVLALGRRRHGHAGVVLDRQVGQEVAQ
ncbi:hypothetical protein TW95_gp1457 [Pandoravirus inopinatum]|uniref:Uncharacterized protein n=1 Tax=Pandoravirus inopinatum TaxID=1605721 RepID=A0A0B5JB38_9VIRU|nr:hypothetical protein TW95_gp1457 [Pandoravirus inopinatum]AJF98191.1 hypothetical protein [Pandoravirus inopinatum]